MSRSDSVPPLAGPDAAYLVRMLATARERDLGLGPAVAVVADIPALPRSRRFARAAAGLDDNELLEVLAESFERGGETAAAGALRALRQVGVPAAGLRRLAGWLERRSALRLKLLGAIVYPLTMMVVGVLVFSVLLHGLLLPVVLHAFNELFDGLGASLPWLTKVFLGVYGFPWLMLSNPVTAVVYVLLVLCLAVAVVWFSLRFSSFAVSARLPLARQFLRWEAASNFTSTLAFLLEQKITLPQAIRLASGAVANPKLGRSLAEVADRVENGENFVEALRDSGALPASVGWRLRSAYYRDQFAAELDAVAATSRTEVDAWERRVRSSARVIVQLVAVIALLPVALAVVAMYLPMFSLIAQIG